MYIELYWKDYRRFGADGSVDALARWLMSRLRDDYGAAIETICITGFCRSLTGPNKNMTAIFERFDETVAKLRSAPAIRFSSNKRELVIEYATVWPTADEFQPDDMMLKVGTFRRAFLKFISLLEESDKKLGTKVNFDFARMISDIRLLDPELPKTLDDLAALYLATKTKKGESGPRD
jgi:hypothetical protein